MLEAMWHRGRAGKREEMKISRGSEGDREMKGGKRRREVTDCDCWGHDCVLAHIRRSDLALVVR